MCACRCREVCDRSIRARAVKETAGGVHDVCILCFVSSYSLPSTLFLVDTPALLPASPCAHTYEHQHNNTGNVWTDVDAARTGNLPFVFEPGMCFEKYVDYAMDVPMYFVYRKGQYINALGQSWRDFMEVGGV